MEDIKRIGVFQDVAWQRNRDQMDRYHKWWKE